MNLIDSEKVQAVIFDLDGLLTDTELMSRRELTVQAAKRGFSIPAETQAAMLGHSWTEAVDILAQAAPPWIDAQDIIDAANKALMKRLSRRGGVKLKPGAIELLSELKRRGLPCAIATSADSDWAGVCLTDLWECFSAVVTGNMVPKAKPAPDLLLRAAELLHVPPSHCAALDDSAAGLIAAKAAGIPVVIWVPDTVRNINPLPEGIVRVKSLHEAKLLLCEECRPREREIGQTL